jgi:hypothetical protein
MCIDGTSQSPRARRPNRSEDGLCFIPPCAVLSVRHCFGLTH